MDYQHERHNVHLVVYHMIWCPKRRRKVLVGPVRDRLEHIIPEVVAEHGWTILKLAIQPDHVHLFLRSEPYTAPSDIARFIKGRSSRFLRDEFPHLLKLPLSGLTAFLCPQQVLSVQKSSSTLLKDRARYEQETKGLGAHLPAPALSDA